MPVRIRRNPQGTLLFNRYHGMKDRRFNPNATSFERYGGRGITICARRVHGENGLTGLECFAADTGEPPTPEHQIERKDNNGNYEPLNCKWALPHEQSRNTRRNYLVLRCGMVG